MKEKFFSLLENRIIAACLFIAGSLYAQAQANNDHTVLLIEMLRVSPQHEIEAIRTPEDLRFFLYGKLDITDIPQQELMGFLNALENFKLENSNFDFNAINDGPGPSCSC